MDTALKTFSSDGYFFDEMISPYEITKYLSSNRDMDKLIGMKFILASVSKGREAAHFFPDVVKNVVVKNLEVKKMVYIYLVHYADYNNACRELALLSINTFQQDMNMGIHNNGNKNNQNQLFRAMALRVLTSINVPDVINIQILAAKKCSLDASPYVRKCSAIACAKLYSFMCNAIGRKLMPHDEYFVQLEEILTSLLSDSDPISLGSAMQAYNTICPDNYTLIHPHLKKICHLAADLNEWTQVAVLEVLSRYLRHHFTKPDDCDDSDEGGYAYPSRGVMRDSGGDSNGNSHCTNTTTNLNALNLPTTATPTPTPCPVLRSGKVEDGFYSDDDSSGEDTQGPVHNARAPILQPPVKNADQKHNKSQNIWKIPNKSESSFQTEVTASSKSMRHTEPHPDLVMTLKATLPLLRSNNSSVVLGVCSLQYYSNNSSAMKEVVKALVRNLRNHREARYVILTTIRSLCSPTEALSKSNSHICKVTVNILRGYIREFYVMDSDPVLIRILKLDILVLLCDAHNLEDILLQLQVYVCDVNPAFVCAALQALGNILMMLKSLGNASTTPGMLDAISIASSSLQGIVHVLLKHMAIGVGLGIDVGVDFEEKLHGPPIRSASNATNTGGVVDTCVSVIRVVLQRYDNIEVAARIVPWLVKMLLGDDGIEKRVPSGPSGSRSVLESGLVETRYKYGYAIQLDDVHARACIIWLVWEVNGWFDTKCDLLRILSRGFCQEATCVKAQILNAALKTNQSLKVNPTHPSKVYIEQLVLYIIELSRYDRDVDFRDRARFLTALAGLSSVGSNNAVASADDGLLAELASTCENTMLGKRLDVINSACGKYIYNKQGENDYYFGSLSACVGQRVVGYVPIEDWSVKGRDRCGDKKSEGTKKEKVENVSTSLVTKNIKQREDDCGSDSCSDSDSDSDSCYSSSSSSYTGSSSSSSSYTSSDSDSETDSDSSNNKEQRSTDKHSTAGDGVHTKKTPISLVDTSTNSVPAVLPPLLEPVLDIDTAKQHADVDVVNELLDSFSKTSTTMSAMDLNAPNEATADIGGNHAASCANALRNEVNAHIQCVYSDPRLILNSNVGSGLQVAVSFKRGYVYNTDSNSDHYLAVEYEYGLGNATGGIRSSSDAKNMCLCVKNCRPASDYPIRRLKLAFREGSFSHATNSQSALFQRNSSVQGAECVNIALLHPNETMKCDMHWVYNVRHSSASMDKAGSTRKSCWFDINTADMGAKKVEYTYETRDFLIPHLMNVVSFNRVLKEFGLTGNGGKASTSGSLNKSQVPISLVKLLKLIEKLDSNLTKTLMLFQVLQNSSKHTLSCLQQDSMMREISFLIKMCMISLFNCAIVGCTFDNVGEVCDNEGVGESMYRWLFASKMTTNDMQVHFVVVLDMTESRSIDNGSIDANVLSSCMVNIQLMCDDVLLCSSLTSCLRSVA